MSTNQGNPIRLAVAGAAGRMGRAVLEAAAVDARFIVTAALVKLQSSSRFVLEPSPDRSPKYSESWAAAPQVLIEFTSRSGARDWLDRCVEANVPLVVGSTGHDEATLARIEAAAKLIPILVESNFAAGLHVLKGLLVQAAKELRSTHDVEVVEAHHRDKRDAPSGTAWSLVDALLGVGEGRREDSVVLGRGVGDARKTRGEIGVHSLRLGDQVAVHEVHFAGEGETLVLRHAAHTRSPFARGALRAAAWLLGKPPGQYGFSDVLREV